MQANVRRAWHTRRSLIALIGIAACAACTSHTNFGFAGLALITGLSTLFAWLFSYDPSRPLTTALFIYLTLFCLFQFGLVIDYGLNGAQALVGSGNDSWVNPMEMQDAVRITLWCLFAFCAGALIAHCRHRNTVVKSRIGQSNVSNTAAAAIAILGMLLLAVTIATNGGISLLGDNYASFLEATQSSSSLGYGLYLYGAGAAMLVSAGGRGARLGWILIAVTTAVLFPLGLRGSVVFPLLVAVFALARRRRISMKVSLPATIVGLILINVVRQTRKPTGVNWTDVGLSPLQAVSEMGYSLRPVIAVTRWMSTGTSPEHGITLVAVPIRYWERYVLGMQLPNPDYRIFNVEVLHRAGPIGGSPVAEGLRNGGPIFAICMLFLIGYSISRIDQLPMTRFATGVGAIVFLPLLIDVRNSFAPVPTELFIGLTLAFLVWRRPAHSGLTHQVRRHEHRSRVRPQ